MSPQFIALLELPAFQCRNSLFYWSQAAILCFPLSLMPFVCHECARQHLSVENAGRRLEGPLVIRWAWTSVDGEGWQWVGAIPGPDFFPGSWVLQVALGQFAGPIRSTGGSPFQQHSPLCFLCLHQPVPALTLDTAHHIWGN